MVNNYQTHLQNQNTFGFERSDFKTKGFKLDSLLIDGPRMSEVCDVGYEHAKSSEKNMLLALGNASIAEKVINNSSISFEERG